MDNEQDEVEIDLKEPEKKVVEGEPEVKIEEKAEKPPKKEVVSADNGIKKLQDQLQKEKQARINAEYSARQNGERAAKAETEVQETQKNTIETSIEFMKAERAILKQRLAAASAAGDHEAVADISEAMSDVAAKLLNLENGKQALSVQPKPRAPEPTDIVEAFASQMKKPSADWIRAHPDFVTDPRKNKKMLAAHSMALADDLVADTPEYFAAIEKTLGLAAEPEEEEALSEAAKPATRRASPAAAPVSRSMGADGRQVNRVTLTKEEVEFAEINGQTKEEYARNKQKLIAEGRLGRSN